MACSTAEACEDCGLTAGGPVNIRLHLIDPATEEPADSDVALSVRLPDGSTVLPPVVHDAVGEYHADFTATQAGQHWYKFVASTQLDVVVQGAFLVAAAVA